MIILSLVRCSVDNTLFEISPKSEVCQLRFVTVVVETRQLVQSQF